VAGRERPAEGRAARFAALARDLRYSFVCTAIFRMTFSSTVTPMPGPVGTRIVPSGCTVNGSPMISVAK